MLHVAAAHILGLFYVLHKYVLKSVSDILKFLRSVSSAGAELSGHWRDCHVLVATASCSQGFISACQRAAEGVSWSL